LSNLIAAAEAAGVGRFVYASARSRCEGACPLIRFKRETEERLTASGLDHVIFRADLFMDTVFAMMGSSTPLRGAENATILRPFASTAGASST